MHGYFGFAPDRTGPEVPRTSADSGCLASAGPGCVASAGPGCVASAGPGCVA